MNILIKNGRVIDAASGTDDTLDILIAGGTIADIKPQIDHRDAAVIDASRLVVVPGLIDMHVHLREPGFEEKETIATGTRAAAKGGFTTVCGMPNTNPVNDSRAVTARILAEAGRSAAVNVLPIAAVSKGSRGEELVDFADLAAAGAVAFSDDGHSVATSRLMRRALEAAKPLDRLIIDHCEDKVLTKDGVMNEGANSAAFSLKGMPAAAEDIIIARDLILARDARARLHIAHLSTKGGAQAIGAAKAAGIPVTAEVTPHHLTLTDAAIEHHDPNCKMNPPLRSREDVEALIEAVRSGVIDVIATDHAPHTEKEKGRDIVRAPFGIVGLETAVPLILDRLVHRNIITLRRFVELMSFNPARLLGLSAKGRLSVGADADLTILNVSKDITIDRDGFASKGRNTPFHGWKLKGQAVVTIVGGRIAYPFDFALSSAPASKAGRPGNASRP